MGPRVGLDALEKTRNLLSPPEIEPRLLSCLARSLVTIPTELSRAAWAYEVKLKQLCALLIKHPAINDALGSQQIDISLF